MIIKLYKLIETFWFEKLPQKLRFLLVGGFNTLSAYLIFTGLYFLFNHNYVMTVVVQYFITINISIVTMRYYVFQSHGNFVKEYLKAAVVYIYLLGFNLVWLYLFVDVFAINGLLSQFLYLFVSTVLTYILHKYFSFNQKAFNKKSV